MSGLLPEFSIPSRWMAKGALGLLLFWGASSPAAAQEDDDSVPEQPSWRAPTRLHSKPPASRSSDDSTSRFDYSPASLDRYSDSADADDQSPDSDQEPIPYQPPSILEPNVDQLGVPSAQGLPDFSINEPWLQLDGLRLRVGPAQIRFDLDLNFGYNDNIFATNSPRVADYITAISPTIEIGIGKYPRPRPLEPLDEEANYFSLNYTPSFQYFAINREQSTVNESLQAEGRYVFRRLSFKGSFSYIESTNPTPADVGRQQYDTYALSLTTSYALSQKTFFQVAVQGSYQEYTEIADSRTTTISVAPGLAYQAGQKLRLTLGPVAGITYVENGGEQPFQSVQLAFEYDTFRKLRFKGMIGVQATQFSGDNPTGAEDFTSPVFSLGATYDINETSMLTLDLDRSVTNSGTASGQTYISTAFSIAFQKTFWHRIRLDLSGSLQSLDYQGGDSRTDTYLALTARLGYLFWQERCNAYLSYTRTQRFSDISAYEYDANYIGTGIGVEF